jgi:hypothetical protein
VETPLTRWTFTIDGSAALRLPSYALGLGLDFMVSLR